MRTMFNTTMMKVGRIKMKVDKNAEPKSFCWPEKHMAKSTVMLIVLEM
jgi:hypothetical protein